MRVCPNCGYRQNPYWRSSKWVYGIDICYVDDFQIIKPDLHKLLLDGRPTISDEYFTYRLAGKGKYYVERIDNETFKLEGWRPKYEGTKKDPFQKKLR